MPFEPPDGPSDFNKLIPSLATWNNSQGASIDVLLSGLGSFNLAVAFSQLFWPPFTLHDHCVLRSPLNLQSYRGFFASTHGNRAAVEDVLNHLHILDLFPTDQDNATPEILSYLGTILQQTWQAKLSRDFPDRHFTVTFSHGSADSPLEYILTFWQPVNEPAVPPEAQPETSPTG